MEYKAFFEKDREEHDFLRLTIAMYQLLQEKEIPKETTEEEHILGSDLALDLQAIGLTEEFCSIEEGRNFYHDQDQLKLLEKWLGYRCELAKKENTKVKALMCRQFLYGIDNADWADEDGNITIYDNIADAKADLEEYIKGEHEALEYGNIEETTYHEFEIRLIIIEDDKLKDALNDQEYSREQA